MKGLLLGALVLVAMDVFLQAPAARVLNAPVPFTNWLRNWMDPTVPLIGGGMFGAPAPSSSPSSSRSSPATSQTRTPAAATATRP